MIVVVVVVVVIIVIIIIIIITITIIVITIITILNPNLKIFPPKPRYTLHGTTLTAFALTTLLTLILAREVDTLDLYNDLSPLHTLNALQRAPGDSGLRRSLRKLSRLAAGKTSTGTWNVPQISTGREVGRKEEGKEEENGGRGGGGEEGDVVQIRRLPSVTLLKTTGV